MFYNVPVNILKREADVKIYICSAQDQGWTTTEVALLAFGRL
jgi:hypothetical protein